MGPMRAFHILIADDRPEVRSALRLILAQRAGAAVVTEASDLGAALDAARQHPPDAVFLDWELPGKGPMTTPQALIEALRTLAPAVAVVALSSSPSARRTARLAGADAFVSKTDPPENLIEALESLNTPRKEAANGTDCQCE
jgi:DNA-binding NarL/FixJ family response regulator